MLCHWGAGGGGGGVVACVTKWVGNMAATISLDSGTHASTANTSGWGGEGWGEVLARRIHTKAQPLTLSHANFYKKYGALISHM